MKNSISPKEYLDRRRPLTDPFDRSDFMPADFFSDLRRCVYPDRFFFRV